MEPPSDRDWWSALTEEPLDVGAVHAFLADERAGGTCVFVGTSRRWTDGAETDLLTYEAYPEMAEAELARLAVVAADHHPAHVFRFRRRMGMGAEGSGHGGDDRGLGID